MKDTPPVRFCSYDCKWNKKDLHTAVKFSKGQGYSKSDLTSEGNPIILYGRLYTDYKSTISIVDTFVVPKANSVFSTGREIVIPASGETAEDIARASFVQQAGVIIGGDLNILIPNNDIAPAFLALAISNGTPQKELSKRAQGKTVVHVHNDDIKEVLVFAPETIQEQEEIAGFFNRIDELIALQYCKCEKLIALKASCLDKMFPQKGSKVPEMRFAGFVGNWEQRRIGEFDVKTGPFGSTLHAEDYVPDGTPIVTTEHFKNGELPLTGEGIPQVSLADAERLKQYELEEHDIVFSRVGSVDLNAEVLKNQVGWLFSGRVLRVRPDNTIDSTFLHYELGTRRVRRSIIDRSVGLTMASINTSILKDTLFYAPEAINEQKAIGNCLRQLDKQITLNQRKLEKLKQLKQAMLHKMFV